MLRIEEGKIFPLTTVHEGSMMDLKEEGFNAFLGMKEIKEDEILEFKNGKFIWSVSQIDNVLFFTLKIGTIIAEMPFHVGLMRPQDSLDAVLERDKEGCYVLFLFLVETKDNILKALRIVHLSEDFSEKIKILLTKQQEEFFDENKYIKTLEEIYEELAPIDIEEMSIITFEE